MFAITKTPEEPAKWGKLLIEYFMNRNKLYDNCQAAFIYWVYFIFWAKFGNPPRAGSPKTEMHPIQFPIEVRSEKDMEHTPRLQHPPEDAGQDKKSGKGNNRGGHQAT